MKMLRLTLALALATAINASTTYKLVDDYSDTAFFKGFDFFTETDPTEGFVSYQGLDSAIDSSLVGYLNGSVFIGSDATKTSSSGRGSVRLESKKAYNHGLFIADIANMPGSTCGVWPALWLVGSDWPTNGEIDLLEGVNDEHVNSVTLHTSAGCAIDASSSSRSNSTAFSGTVKTPNCDVAAPNQSKNAGCSITAPASLPSYGTSFNAAGGGVYAMLWTSTGITAWFFPRDKIPADLSSSSASASASSPSPSTWGAPIARFSGSGCNWDARFKDLKIVINTTFCGQWAGGVWESGGCAKKTGVSTCAAYVRDHPEKFEDAFWEIKGLRWYDEIKGVVRRERTVERRWVA